MPELPEVEVIVRTLREQVVGQKIDAVRVGWSGSIDRPDVGTFCKQVSGRTVAAIRRRGKFILFELLPTPAQYLLAHLRMTGRFLFTSRGGAEPGAAAPDKHCRLSFALQSGDMLHFCDVRKFGRLYLVSDPDEVIGDLGPEPLSDAFTADRLRAILRGHRRQIKPLLMNQRVLAGLGNIYTDEALWEAGVHPLCRSDTLRDDEVDRLHAAIRRTLLQAIANRGTTLQDFRDPSGEAGANQEFLAVYGREGALCVRCGHTIERISVGGRGTRYCAACQPLREAGQS